MAQRERRRNCVLTRGMLQVQSPSATAHQKLSFVRIGHAHRKALLLGTALVSTLLLGTIAAPMPAAAVITCAGDVGPAIDHTNGGAGYNESIFCVNTEPRTGGAFAIGLGTDGLNRSIYLNNSGDLTATYAARTIAITAFSYGNDSPLTIINSGDILVTVTNNSGAGIYGYASGLNSSVTINNSGDIWVTSSGYGSRSAGIYGGTNGSGSPVSITNSGNITVKTSHREAIGIGGYALIGESSPVSITNSGDITATTTGPSLSIGIRIRSNEKSSPISVVNSGDIAATSTGYKAYAIFAKTYGNDNSVTIQNSGNLTATAANVAQAIYGATYGNDSSVTIQNSGNLIATTANRALGIYAKSVGTNSPISITNNGGITATSNAGSAYSISADTQGANSLVNITNRGELMASSGTNAVGITASTRNANDAINIVNSGDITTRGTVLSFGIRAFSYVSNSPVNVGNSGDISARGGVNGVGILAFAYSIGNVSSVSIVNSGDISVGGKDSAGGIAALAPSGSVTIKNSGAVFAQSPMFAGGIYANSGIGATIINSGDLMATASAGNGYGIRAQTQDANAHISVTNSGDITATAGGDNAAGISTQTQGANSRTSITNRGDITATSNGMLAAGINAQTQGANSPISINNSGDISATGATNGVGILTVSGSSIDILNSGDISVKGGLAGGGIVAISPYSSVRIENQGSVFSQSSVRAIGIYAISNTGATIVNTGNISSSLQLAIDVNGAGAASIYNAGKIMGFVDLTEQNDLFVNQAGGVFELQNTTSLFGGGNDVFVNQAGGTVQAASNANVTEISAFQGLETFKNQGTISTVDGATGDSFTLSNTPGGTDLNFIASGNSTLAVDAFLGGPGNSASDTFTVQGNVSGVTTVQINNTNAGPGVFNSTGIPVVFVTGKTPSASNFQLAKPIDTGFVNYDLFFTPTGSGFWSLKSFPGGGAHLLPQLETAAQDIWHEGSSTWFDRTADLRVLLNGGATTTAYDPGGKSLSAAPSGNITPAVWARGSGGWLARNDSASTSAYGRTYTYNLDRNLQTMDFQVGLDLGKRDVLSQGDALVFGVLGGFVQANLDYDSLVRQFDFNGGQVGAYATYLKGGLFVDTLFNAHLYELNPNATLGFPNSLDASTLGVRTDTGYRFGGFSGGAFLEPLATIEVMWANIDGFSLGGNTVSFNDDPNVRGRLGLRAGTTMQAWTGTMMEPFVIGSLWGNLSDNNQATLVSTGNTFRYQDNLQDAWGEVSAGVNFFNFSQTTSVFAKADVTFGDDLTGVGGKAGMRVSW